MRTASNHGLHHWFVGLESGAHHCWLQGEPAVIKISGGVLHSAASLLQNRLASNSEHQHGRHTYVKYGGGGACLSETFSDSAVAQSLSLIVGLGL